MTWILSHQLGNFILRKDKIIETTSEYYEFSDAQTQAIAKLREGMKKYEDEPVIGDIFQVGSEDHRYLSYSWTCKNTYPDAFTGLYIAHMITVQKKETDSA